MINILFSHDDVSKGLESSGISSVFLLRSLKFRCLESARGSLASLRVFVATTSLGKIKCYAHIVISIPHWKNYTYHEYINNYIYPKPLTNKNCIGENHTYTFCLLVTSLYHWLAVLRDWCLWWLPLDSSKWLLRRHGCGLSGFDGLKLTKLSWLVGLNMSI